MFHIIKPSQATPPDKSDWFHHSSPNNLLQPAFFLLLFTENPQTHIPSDHIVLSNFTSHFTFTSQSHYYTSDISSHKMYILTIVRPDKNLQKTLRVFGVGRRTVGRGTLAEAALPARSRQRPEVSPPLPMVRRRPIRLVDDVAVTKYPTTSRLTLCGAQLGISGCFLHPINYFRLTNSTSGLGPVPQT